MFELTPEIMKSIKESPLGDLWHSIGIKHHHGIACMLASIRTENSSGIGEYLDILPLIDFCKSAGFDIIQFLPLNDSGEDPSPYNALSSIALHPIYLSLHALPNIDKYPELLTELKNFKPYNSTERVDYHGVLKAKNAFLKLYYEKEKEHILERNDFPQFVLKNSWVKEYALYKTLRESMTFKTWREWPEALKNPTEERIAELAELHKESIAYHYFLQFFCSIQLTAAKEYATKNGLFLKGDIPILISTDSADVWLDRRFFDLGFTVGVPPDQFNENGQYWGFPAYNWHVLKESNFIFWKIRLEMCEKYYHIYRIDHVLGFYRFWLIPEGKPPKEGFFSPNQLDVAITNGHEYLKNIVKFSPLLPVAEDLGVLPQGITYSLRGLGIAGTNVIRWERNYENKGLLIALNQYEPLSMTTVSTHDSDTLALWWENSPIEVEEFCILEHLPHEQHLSKELRFKILRKAHHNTSLLHINLLQEYLALFDDLIIGDLQKERINIPGFVLPTNWTYRFKPSIEEMFLHPNLIKSIQSIINGNDSI